jgi:hypothetical protein
LEQEIEKSLKKQLEKLEIGDLICVSWSDASVGKSHEVGGSIDVIVQSWGIYLGLLGKRLKHFVLGQNSFCYGEDVYDMDYTAIPLSWSTEIWVIHKGYVPRTEAAKMVDGFIQGGGRTFNRPRTFQRHKIQKKLSVDGRPD